MGRGTKFVLAMVAALCIAAAFLSPLFTSRAPLVHGKTCGGSGYVLVAWTSLLTADLALLVQMRQAATKSARRSGSDLLALTCTLLC